MGKTAAYNLPIKRKRDKSWKIESGKMYRIPSCAQLSGMKAILIGYGKMGSYILRALKKNDAVTDLYVCDSKFSSVFHEDDVTFITSIETTDITKFSCAFIATPVKTHF